MSPLYLAIVVPVLAVSVFATDSVLPPIVPAVANADRIKQRYSLLCSKPLPARSELAADVPGYVPAMYHSTTILCRTLSCDCLADGTVHCFTRGIMRLELWNYFAPKCESSEWCRCVDISAKSVTEKPPVTEVPDSQTESDERAPTYCWSTLDCRAQSPCGLLKVLHSGVVLGISALATVGSCSF